MAATVDIQWTDNISSSITAIGGAPKSVRIGGVSGNGSVVVGQFVFAKAPGKWQVFRYSRSTGFEILENMGDRNVSNLCLSADGLVIWGNFKPANDDERVFRYTKALGFQDLGTLERKWVATYGVSADGSVVVGRFLSSTTSEKAPRYHAFRYSQSGGFEDLGPLGGQSAFARGISPDGSLIVGNFHIAKGSDHAFYYSRAGGLKDIGAVGGTAAFASGISNDGSVIVGTFFGGFSFFQYKFDNHVFIYTNSKGVQKLGTMGGKSAGLPRISADGKTMVGWYLDSEGESYVYSALVL